MDNQTTIIRPQTSTETQPQPQSPPPTPLLLSPPKTKRSKMPLIVLLILLILVAGVIGTYMWQHKKLTSSNAKVSSLQTQLSSLQNRVNELSKQTTAASTSSVKSNSPTYISGAACQSSQLTLALDLNLKSNMNQTGAYFSLTNTSNVLCTLSGYPGLTAKTVSGQTIDSSRGSSYLINNPSAQTVALGPNTSAYFGVGWAELNSSGSSADCLNTTTVSATPPNNTAPLTISANLSDICGDVSVTNIAPKSAFSPTSP